MTFELFMCFLLLMIFWLFMIFLVTRVLLFDGLLMTFAPLITFSVFLMRSFVNTAIHDCDLTHRLLLFRYVTKGSVVPAFVCLALWVRILSIRLR